jgi:23S rRNA (pseudouridine1915-N3)-methyltransferase
MMRITIAAVGKFGGGKNVPERALFEHYAGRISGSFDLKEVEEKRRLPDKERKRSEGSLLLKTIPDGAFVVALDERGKSLTSIEFSKKIGSWQDDGVRDLFFVIGGANGHSDEVLKRANFKLSLSSLTWPHLLVRGMLAEQIFRAQSILSGHPYHRE